MNGLREKNLNFISLDSGDLFFKSFYPHEDDRPQMRLKAGYVLKLFNLLKLDCFVPGEMDFAEGAGFLFNDLLSKADFTVTGSNITLPPAIEKTAAKILKPWKIIEKGKARVLVVGLCNATYNASAHGDTVRILDPVHHLRSTLESVGQDYNVLIVLSHLGRAADEELCRVFPQITVIVGGHDATKKEPLVSGSTLIVEAYKLGMYPGRLDMTLELQKETNRYTVKSWKNAFVPMSKDIADDPEGAELLKQYKADVVELNSKVVSTSNKKEKKKVFWFEPLCQYCHKEQHEFWQKTAHSNAYATLEKRNSHMDYDCVGCHTIGMKQNGGWRDFSQVERFKNVQCEACHGPGSEHSTSTYGTNASKPKTCGKCHDADHDPDFNLQEALKKIRCPKLPDDEME